MTRDNKNSDSNSAQLSFDDLRRRQSVRATFKLPQEIIELLGVIARQLSIKQKSLLDQLIEDTSLLSSIAQEAKKSAEQDTLRRQKTYVLSRSSLHSLNDVAQKANISRDIIVEFSIKRLLPIIETELTKHNERKVVFNEMRDRLRDGEKLCQKARRLLGTDDILVDMLEKQQNLAKKNILEAQAIIERGMPMEDW